MRKTYAALIVLFIITGFTISPGLPIAAMAENEKSSPLAPDTAQQQKQTQKQEIKEYTVVKGDTLWDISENFLENPFRWPELWKANPRIENPHLIYPGDLVRITPEGIVIIPSGLAVKRLVDTAYDTPDLPVTKLGKQPVLLFDTVLDVKSGLMKRAGFVTKKAFEKSGVIVKPTDAEKLYLNEGDSVFLSMKNDTPVEVGDRFTVCKAGKRIYNPETRRYLGSDYDVIGEIVITKTGDYFEGKIEVAYKEVGPDAFLIPYEEPISKIKVIIATEDIQALVISTFDNMYETGLREILYIDKGTDDGLQVGNMLVFYRKRSIVKDPLNKKLEIILPEYVLGQGIIVKTKESSSSVFIVESTDTVHLGDYAGTTIRK